MSGYRESKKRDWYTSLALIAIYFTIIAVTAVFLLISYWYIWVGLAAVGGVLLVFWHAKSTAYYCPRCGFMFEISVLADFLSPHGVSKKGAWKYLKCPNCQHRSRMAILVKKKDED
jgi:transcription elongation factor Elf1